MAIRLLVGRDLDERELVGERADDGRAHRVDVKDNAGKVTQWTVEAGSPSALGVVNWGRNPIKIGDEVTIWVFQTKTGLPVGRLNKIQLPDGTLLRDSQVGGDNGERTDNDLK